MKSRTFCFCYIQHTSCSALTFICSLCSSVRCVTCNISTLTAVFYSAVTYTQLQEQYYSLRSLARCATSSSVQYVIPSAVCYDAAAYSQPAASSSRSTFISQVAYVHMFHLAQPDVYCTPRNENLTQLA